MSDAYKIEIITDADVKDIFLAQKAFESLNKTIDKPQTYDEYLDELAISAGELADGFAKAGNAGQDYEAKIKGAGGQSKTTGDEVEKFKTKLGGLSSVFQGMGISIGMSFANALAKIPNILGGMIDEFATSETASVRLQAALEQTGEASVSNVAKLEALANKMEILTNADGKEVLSTMSVASAMGVTADQMAVVTESAIGISKALNMDLATATKASAAAFQGKTDLLSRYIPTLSECATEEDKLAKVQKLSASGMAMALAEVNTFGGAMTALGHSFGAVSEIVGGSFVPPVKSAVTILNKLLRLFTEYPKTVDAVTKAVASLIGAMAISKVLGFAGAMKTAVVQILATGKASLLSSISVKGLAFSFRGLGLAIKSAVLSVPILGAALFALSYAIEAVVMWLASEDKSLEKNQKNLQKNKQSTDELAKARERLANIQLDAMKAIEDYEFSFLSNQEKLNMLEYEEVMLHHEMVDASKLIYSNDIKIAETNAKIVKDNIARLKIIDSQIASLESAKKAEEECATQAEKQRLASEKSANLEALSLATLKKRNADELALLKAKADGDESAIESITERIKLEDLARSYERSGVALGEEANDLAKEKIKLEKQIQANAKATNNANKANAYEMFILEKEIESAKINGNQQRSTELELQLKTKQLQQDAIAMMSKYGIPYAQALKDLKKLDELEKQRAKGEQSVEYSKADTAKAQKILERGEGGSIGKNTIAQAQAIVDGKAIQGDELAIFSGVKQRSTEQKDNSNIAYRQALNLGQTPTSQTPQSANINTSQIATQQARPQAIQQVQTQPTQQAQDLQKSDSDQSNKDVKDLVKKIEKLIDIQKSSNDLLADIKTLNQSSYY